MLDNELERTKYWIRQFILAKRLGVQPQVPDSEYRWLQLLWNGDCYPQYKALYLQVEKEMLKMEYLLTRGEV